MGVVKCGQRNQQHQYNGPACCYDGRYCKTVATVEEGNKLVKVQVPDASTGYHTTKEVREWSEDGKEMTLHLIIPAKPEIVCKRFYKRVEPTEGEETEEAQ